MIRSRQNTLAPVFVALLLATAPSGLRAQQNVPLLTFTNIWRFNDSGMDLGTSWRDRDFNDNEWLSGAPLLGVETTPGIYPIPFSTTFDPFNVNTITYYFRTHFLLPRTNVAGVTLRATIFVDDGCVIYLNGAEAGRIRVPLDHNFQTVAETQAMEGQAEVIPLNVAALQPGDNVLSVEVHQSAPGSSDLVLGLSLDAQLPEPLVITNQPRSQTILARRFVVFDVGVQGNPVTYRWRRNQIAISGATRASYTNANVQLADAGNYSVVVSNGFGVVTSDDAVLTVVPDNQGPRMLSATVLFESTRTNRIQIAWDERILNTTVSLQSATNFQVIMVPSNLRVAISNVQYNPGIAPLPGAPATVTLTMNTTNWHVGSNYYVSVSQVRDVVGNVIAPESRISVSWPRITNVIGFGQLWSFHAASLFEPEIFEQPWYATNFVESGPWWGQGVGPFCGGMVRGCSIDSSSCETTIGLHPSLFRTTFVAPTNLGSFSQLRLAYFVDDAAIFYLNGMELFRYNLPPAPTPPTFQTKALTSVNAACATNTIPVTNLFPGTNWLAAAVFQSADPSDADSTFFLALDHIRFFDGQLPEVPIPRLNIAPTGVNGFRLWWDGPGYALESTTNLSFTDGGPVGAWLEVTNMSNPFIDVLNGERRFFRLRQ